MTVAAFLSTAGGHEWLAARGVHTDPERFYDALAMPLARDALALPGVTGERPVIYVGQQVAGDFSHLTAVKFAAARDLAAAGRVDSVIAWHDMDRVGSDRFGMRIVFEFGVRFGVWLAPRKLEHREPRFIAVEPARLDEVFTRARAAVDALAPAARESTRARIDALAARVETESLETIADATRALGGGLLSQHMGVDLPSTYVSALMAMAAVQEVLVDVLSERANVVRVYNAALDQLRSEGVDPHLRPLDDRWLPLWWSCPASGRRLRLLRVTSGEDTYGVVDDCPCGDVHRFHLGGRQASIDELDAAGRWSPDVLLPVLLDPLFSGYVAGQSSALYGLPMRTVLRDVLSIEPTPAFLPDLAAVAAPAGPDSILHAYLTAAA